MTRTIFNRATKDAILARADGICECGCELPFGTEDVHYDHYPIPAAWDGSATIENGRALRKKCHNRITAKVDVPKIAKVKRIVEKRQGLRTQSPGMPGTRRSGWKKKINGSVERR